MIFKNVVSRCGVCLSVALAQSICAAQASSSPASAPQVSNSQQTINSASKLNTFPPLAPAILPAQAISTSTGVAPPATVSPGDILALSRIVLDTSREHSQASADRMQMLMYFFGALGALVAFFGFREWKAVVKPTKDKLEGLEVAHAGHIEKQKKDFDAIVLAHKNDLDAQMQVIKGDHQTQMEAVKTDHEVQMQKMVEEFTKRMHRNAVALIASQLIWDVIDRSERENVSQKMKEDLYRDVVSRVDKVCGPEDGMMDGYLMAILLIRKAYVLKRLGEFAFAYETAVRALAVAGENPHVSWFYNAACYAALASLPEQCCQHLEKAVQMSAETREDAKNESDFESVKTLDTFIALIG